MKHNVICVLRRACLAFIAAVALLCILCLYSNRSDAQQVQAAGSIWCKAVVDSNRLYLRAYYPGGSLFYVELTNSMPLSRYGAGAESILVNEMPIGISRQDQWDVRNIDYYCSYFNDRIYTSVAKIYRVRCVTNYISGWLQSETNWEWGASYDIEPMCQMNLVSEERHSDIDVAVESRSNVLIAVYYRYRIPDRCWELNKRFRPRELTNSLSIYKIDETKAKGADESNYWLKTYSSASEIDYTLPRVLKKVSQYNVSLRGCTLLVRRGNAPYIVTEDNKLFRCGKWLARHVADIYPVETTNRPGANYLANKVVIIDKERNEILFPGAVRWRTWMFRDKHVREASTDCLRDRLLLEALTKADVDAREECDAVLELARKRMSKGKLNMCMPPYEAFQSADAEAIHSRLFDVCCMVAMCVVAIAAIVFFWRDDLMCAVLSKCGDFIGDLLKSHRVGLSRMWKWALRIAVPIVILALYVLSVGPVRRYELLPEPAFKVIYAPIGWAIEAGVINPQLYFDYVTWW